MKDYVSEQIKSELKNKPELTVNLKDTIYGPSNIREKQDELWEEKMKPFSISLSEENNIYLKNSEKVEETEEVKPYSINISSDPKTGDSESDLDSDSSEEESEEYKKDLEEFENLKKQVIKLNKELNKEVVRLRKMFLGQK